MLLNVLSPSSFQLPAVSAMLQLHILIISYFDMFPISYFYIIILIPHIMMTTRCSLTDFHERTMVQSLELLRFLIIIIIIVIIIINIIGIIIILCIINSPLARWPHQ